MKRSLTTTLGLLLLFLLASAAVLPAQQIKNGRDTTGVYNALDYGLRADAKTGQGLSGSATGTTLTSSVAVFSASDVNKTVVIAQAGASSAQYTGTITAYTDATHVTVSPAFGTTFSSSSGVWGTDNTTAVQRALTLAGNAGGGEVYLGRGAYLFTGNLTLPEYVSLRGSNKTHSHTGFVTAGNPKPDTRGTTLLTTTGAGSTSGTPFLLMKHSSCLEGLTFYQPTQPLNLVTPIAFPWTLDGDGANNARNCTITDCEFFNLYLGARMLGVERPTFERITGQPLSIGIRIDNCYDTPRVRDIHFNPYWSGNSGNTYTWQLSNGVGLQVGKADWASITGCLLYGYKIDLWFHSDNGSGGKYGAPTALVSGCEFDTADTCVWIDDTDSNVGIALTNCVFAAGATSTSRDIYFNPPTDGAALNISNCFFPTTSSKSSNILMGTAGSGGPHITVSGCKFNSVLDNNMQIYAGMLTVSGCTFSFGSSSGGHENIIGLGSGVIVTATGNTSTTGFVIRNAGGAASGNFTQTGNK